MLAKHLKAITKHPEINEVLVYWAEKAQEAHRTESYWSLSFWITCLWRFHTQKK